MKSKTARIIPIEMLRSQKALPEAAEAMERLEPARRQALALMESLGFRTYEELEALVPPLPHLTPLETLLRRVANGEDMRKLALIRGAKGGGGDSPTEE